MKRFGKILSLLLVSALFVSALPSAYASGTAADKLYTAGGRLLENDGVKPADGETLSELDDIMEGLLVEYEADADDVYAGYLNLVTGEEYYWQGDEWVIAASMYKVPLNMIFAERIASGELDWDANYPYADYEMVRDETIINSSNDWAMFLWDLIGGYSEFRRLIMPYMGIDESEVDYEYYANNRFTPRQMINCLKTLYEGGEERFPTIIETMQKAEPERFFRYSEQRFNIAQKYGYVTEGASSFMNCCGICFPDEPIAIVMFTRSVYRSEELLTAFCTAMCEYTQSKAEQRLEKANAAVLAELAERETEGALLSPAAGTQEPDAEQIERQNKKEVVTLATIICCAAIIIGAIIMAAVILAKKKKYGIKVFWMLVSVIVCAAALMLCAICVRAGTIYAKPDGDPAETAKVFFDAIDSGDYETAYACLRDYTSLGLENTPQSETGAMASAALKESYGYELVGACEREKLTAHQKVNFTYLDLTKTHDDITDTTMDELEKLVKKLPRDEIYDENNQYKPEVANEAYRLAVEDVLKNAQNYYSTVEIDLELAYANGKWQVITSPALLKALNGGTTY